MVRPRYPADKRERRVCGESGRAKVIILGFATYQMEICYIGDFRLLHSKRAFAM